MSDMEWIKDEGLMISHMLTKYGFLYIASPSAECPDNSGFANLQWYISTKREGIHDLWTLGESAVTNLLEQPMQKCYSRLPPAFRKIPAYSGYKLAETVSGQPIPHSGMALVTQKNIWKFVRRDDRYAEWAQLYLPFLKTPQQYPSLGSSGTQGTQQAGAKQPGAKPSGTQQPHTHQLNTQITAPLAPTLMAGSGATGSGLSAGLLLDLWLPLWKVRL